VACFIAGADDAIRSPGPQGYWQRAIASRPESTTKAYMLGGIAWFGIPFSFGTTLGLASRALQFSPKYPTYPYALSAAQQSAGLAAPAAAVALLGKGGAAAVLLVVFMAATSAMSAELIACSSILTYDLAGTYFRPLSSSQVVKWSHIIIAGLAIWMGIWGMILNKAGIDLGWLFYFQGTACSPAVVPIGLTVCWRRMSRVAALYGTLFGAVCGMLGWFIGCYKIYGAINTTNLAESYSAICGSLPGLLFSSLAVLVLTWLFPDTSTNWDDTQAISGSDAVKTNDNIARKSARLHGTPADAAAVDEEKKELDASVLPAVDAAGTEEEQDGASPLDHAVLQRTFKRAAYISLSLCFVLMILVPMPMFGQSYIFSSGFFTFWVAVAIIWVLVAGMICICLPVWESRHEIVMIVRGLTGLKRKEDIA